FVTPGDRRRGGGEDPWPLRPGLSPGVPFSIDRWFVARCYGPLLHLSSVTHRLIGRCIPGTKLRPRRMYSTASPCSRGREMPTPRPPKVLPLARTGRFIIRECGAGSAKTFERHPHRNSARELTTRRLRAT